ncbi:MAG: hypothetical protein WD278_12785 [Pirellulales bacterium]
MIIAAVTSAESTLRTSFEWGRIQAPSDWLLPLVVSAAVLAYVWFMYRRDSAELSAPVGVLLTGLRMAAFVGLLVVYLEPQWRNERDQVYNSRVLLLADTSLSMGLVDHDSSPVPAEPSRGQKVIAALSQGGLLNALRAKHDVVLVRFDSDSGRVVSLEKFPAAPGDGQTAETGDAQVMDESQWQQALAPRGPETRLGQALRQLISEEQAAPVAGVVVFTDGGHNAGIEPAAAVGLAREAGIAIYPVGLGSLEQPVNVRVSDFVAPARAYPGDSYTATGYIQAQGLAGKVVNLELYSRDAASGPAPGPGQAGQLEDSQELVLGGDGEVVPVTFTLTPSVVGRRTLRLRVAAPAEDRHTGDNQQEVDIEVVDRKSRVLLFAGGPSREYQFLRNQLRRDRNVEVDVLLQTGSQGISQDAHQILGEFPLQPEELFAYDCIVAFDPDWRRLSQAQQELVQRWVGDHAGGLIVVAGPIYTDQWAQDPAMSRIRTLYPVEFERRFSLLDDARYGSSEPWPIEFTRDGLEAEFLWLEESAPASSRAWQEFDGVFGYYAVRGPKPATTVYGRFSDPQSAAGSQQPVYLAGGFFGSGRVFYLGSGEMWRLRAHDEAWFERFYTKLIRHVTQGRLLRGSSRGVLLVERDRYLLGGTVDVRAQLSDARLEPLELPAVTLEVTSPDGLRDTLPLSADAQRAGNYRGQFTVRKEGVYQLELPVPESQERLARRIQVKVPDLERENPQRNDALLSELAGKTGGIYYVGLESALGKDLSGGPLVERLPDKSRTVTLTAIPTRLWDNPWTLLLLSGVLCLEWLVRRLVKLA